MGEYLDRLDQGIAGNAAYLVPQGTVRALVVGWDDGPATAAELAAMQDVVRTAMAQGAVGLSSGLTYTPGMYADSAELLALLPRSASCGGFYGPHHRSYGEGALAAYAEMIDLATRAGCPLHLAHATMNFAREQGPRRRAAGPARRRARRRGRHHPGHLPVPARRDHALGHAAELVRGRHPDETLARLRDPAARERIRDDLEVTGSDGCHGVLVEWDTIEISGVRRPELGAACRSYGCPARRRPGG